MVTERLAMDESDVLMLASYHAQRLQCIHASGVDTARGWSIAFCKSQGCRLFVNSRLVLLVCLSA
jgi:hypothetical protein